MICAAAGPVSWPDERPFFLRPRAEDQAVSPFSPESKSGSWSPH